MYSDPSADLASRKIVVTSNLDPDPSSGLNFKGVIAQGFRWPFLLNSSWCGFETVDEEQKIKQSSVGTYGGILKLYKVCRTKTEQYDVATYGGRIHVYIYSSGTNWAVKCGYVWRDI